MACRGCEIVPETSAAAGTLFLAPALDHTRVMLERELQEDGWTVEQAEEGVVGVPVPDSGLPTLLNDLGGRLSLPEQNGCQAVFIEEGQAFSMSRLFQTRPLRVMVAQTENRWLSELIRDERVLMHFHPIVHSSDPASVFAYECLLRGVDREGGLIPPDRLFAASRAADLMFHLDRLARVTAIREANRHGIQSHVFINFNPTSIYDPAFCLRTTLNEIDRSELDNERFVFEVVESDAVEDTQNLLDILAEYRRKGFGVALDDLGAGYGSLNLLQQLHPDFVKLDRDLVRGVHLDPYKGSITQGLLEMARRIDVRTVAEGVEEFHEWQWLRDHGVDFIQGFYFGKPTTPPREPVVPAR